MTQDAIRLDSPITTIRGINVRLAGRFRKLGVVAVRDLLYFFPRRHLDYSRRSRVSELEIGCEQTIVARVYRAGQKRSLRGMRSTEAIVGDETGTVRVIWFNQPYLAKRLTGQTTIAISGMVETFEGRKVFRSPEYELVAGEDLLHTGGLIPVYPVGAGLYQRQVRRLVKEAMDCCLALVEDHLPQHVRDGAGVVGLQEAIRQTHFPDNEACKTAARRRLVFDELLLVQLGVQARRRDRKRGGSVVVPDARPAQVGAFLSSLPFELTAAQKRVLAEIGGDLARCGEPMGRLLQGEVGSGKTVVAVAAMLVAVANGWQAALMAPTEILAEQHFENVCGLLGGQTAEGAWRACAGSLRVGLLLGRLSAVTKRDLCQSVAAGEIDMLIGTHALVQRAVEFKRLGLVVVDEQHRFGVAQRTALRQKGDCPHMLVMSATPIPRTLALTMYGDLDISTIDELPPGRREIKTRWLSPRERASGYEFARKQVAMGHQVFVVCPLVDESEAVGARAAVAEYERLSGLVFPDLKLGLLHGRMAASEKEEVMRQFRAGELQVLVATPVVEVGVDIPNATLMLIEGAERFGLAQLHQFRGRVWRSSHQSYCLLLADNLTAEGKERLSLMEKCHDGFHLAEEDLRMRGPGDFFGTRQSGLPEFRMARQCDVALLELARSEAMRIMETDPDLELREHRLLAAAVARLWQEPDRQ